jgi:glycosyltransferase involved in cell wall biosynthesis
MQPLVSIIIPTYNRAHLIGETLDSILVQTYTNWECIIVDDGSRDDTQKVVDGYLKKDKRFQYHQRPKNRIKGANSCRNYGFELSKGEYIKWFDSDDIMLPNLLENQILSFSKNSDMSVCKLIFFDSHNGITIRKNRIDSENLIEDYLVGKVAFYISGPLWRRSFLNNQKTLFDEDISNLDDWDFNLRMLYEEPSIVYIDESLIKYRIHKNSLSKEIVNLNFEEINSEFYAREKHIRLLRVNKKSDSYILKSYMKNRCQYIFRDALIRGHCKKKYFLCKLLIYQWKMRDFFGIPKTIFGFVLYSFFNRGYKYL